MKQTSKVKSSKEEVTELLKRIDDGVMQVFNSEAYRDYLSFYSKFTDYSANNILLISLQRPNATAVASFTKWKQLGRHVKQGEKGIAILAPMFFKRDDSSDNSDEEDTYIIFKKVYVFDVSQTEGKELPGLTKELTGDIARTKLNAILAALESVTGIPVQFEKIESATYGYYSSITNQIIVKSGLPDLQTIKTAIHETAHCLLHGSSSDAKTKEASREEKEVQAESVAFIVSDHFGLDTSSYSFPYIATWSQGKPTNHLKTVLSEIHHTSQIIINAIEDNLSRLSDSCTTQDTGLVKESALIS